MEPRPITFIADLLAAPKPDVTPTPVAGIPDGVEVTDPQVRAEAERVVESLIICVNQGELLRSFSLFDDEYLRRIIDPEGVMEAEVAIELAKSIATPVAVAPEDMTTLDAILLVRQQPDGAVTVVFRTKGGPGPGSGRDAGRPLRAQARERSLVDRRWPDRSRPRNPLPTPTA